MVHEALHSTLLKALDKILYGTHGHSPTVLFVADENCPPNLLTEAGSISQLDVLTNRFDIAHACTRLDLTVHFSDFDFSSLQNTYDLIIYRISKERPVCHHVLNEASKVLRNNGALLLIGKKNEGIKGYHQKLIKECGWTGGLRKDKNTYLATMMLASSNDKSLKLEDKDYTRLRRIDLPTLSFFSKPGIFGWDKIDVGSELLMTTIIHDDRLQSAKFGSVLDLGCGYGYLSMRVQQVIAAGDFPSMQYMYATDNNAAAIFASAKNLNSRKSKLHCEVVADDCGANIDRKFDLLLCNPPFHQGFDNSWELTHKFLNQASRLIESDGIACFVVNRFIPLESIAEGYFSDVEIQTNDKRFKVALLKK